MSRTDDRAETFVDFAAWRPVLTGLSVIRATLFAAMYGLIVAVVLVFALFGLLGIQDVGWFGLLALGTVGLSVLITVAAMLLGMGLCCLAPSEGGAKRYAQAAFVLALTTVTLASIPLFLELAPPLNRTASVWLRDMIWQYRLAAVFLSILVLNVTLAVACWHRFIQAAATVLKRHDLAYSAKGMVVLWIAWTACATFFCLLTHHWDSWHILPLMVLGPVVTAGAPALFVGSISLVLGLRRALLERLEADRTDRQRD